MECNGAHYVYTIGEHNILSMIFFRGREKLVSVDGMMNGSKFREILKKAVEINMLVYSEPTVSSQSRSEMIYF